MPRKRHTPEQIIGKLREAEVGLASGQTVHEVCTALGITEQNGRVSVPALRQASPRVKPISMTVVSRGLPVHPISEKCRTCGRLP